MLISFARDGSPQGRDAQRLDAKHDGAVKPIIFYFHHHSPSTQAGGVAGMGEVGRLPSAPPPLMNGAGSRLRPAGECRLSRRPIIWHASGKFGKSVDERGEVRLAPERP